MEKVLLFIFFQIMKGDTYLNFMSSSLAVFQTSYLNFFFISLLQGDEDF